MNTKQTLENNILTKLITNTIHTPCGAPKQSYLTNNNLHNRTEAFASELKQPSQTYTKQKSLKNNSQTSLHKAQTKSTGT